MFPATSQSLPAALAIAPASEVTVVLPFVPVTAMTAHALRRLGEQFDIANHAHPRVHRATHQRFGERHAGTDRNEVDAREALVPKRAASRGNTGQRLPQGADLRRHRTRVGDAHVRTAACEPLRHRQSRVTQAQHQRLSASEIHRSFNVERPKSTSIMVMIQKRTTT